MASGMTSRDLIEKKKSSVILSSFGNVVEFLAAMASSPEAIAFIKNCV